MTILISRTDLARNTRKVIDDARRSGPVLVESYGEQQAALLDITDYRLLRAVATWQPDPAAPFGDPNAIPTGLHKEDLEKATSDYTNNPQAYWNLVIAAYLDINISMGKAAELLNVSRFELQDRLNRLDLPIHLGPRTIEEARRELEVADSLRA